MTDPLGNWCPDWQRILSSNVWIEDILPWLKDMEREVEREFDNIPDMENLRFSQGQLKVLRHLQTMPVEAIEMEKLEKEREVEDAGKRRGWAIRRGRG